MSEEEDLAAAQQAAEIERQRREAEEERQLEAERIARVEKEDEARRLARQSADEAVEEANKLAYAKTAAEEVLRQESLRQEEEAKRIEDERLKSFLEKYDLSQSAHAHVVPELVPGECNKPCTLWGCGGHCTDPNPDHIGHSCSNNHAF